MSDFRDTGHAQFKPVPYATLADLADLTGSVFVEGEFLRIKDSVFRVEVVEAETMVLCLMPYRPHVGMISGAADNEIERLASFNEPADPKSQRDQYLSAMYAQIQHLIRQIRHLKSKPEAD